jgi:DNA topoisomerase I
VKTLESEGIGRRAPTPASSAPSSTAATWSAGNQLVPTFTAFAVTGLLEKHFPSLVDTRFTARMEEELDEIAEGEAEWLPYLRDFFLGPEGLESRCGRGRRRSTRARRRRSGSRGCRARCGSAVRPLRRDAGRRRDGDRVAPRGDRAGRPLGRRRSAARPREGRGPGRAGHRPGDRRADLLLSGRFGPYVQLGRGREGRSRARVAAEGVWSRGRDTGAWPSGSSRCRARSAAPGDGQGGPGGDRAVRPLRRAREGLPLARSGGRRVHRELERALELLASRSGGRKAPSRCARSGPHPADGEPILLFAGRYGPYVKHGAVNASLPEGRGPRQLTVEEAVELLGAEEGARRPGCRKKKGTAEGGAREEASPALPSREGRGRSRRGRMPSKGGTDASEVQEG